MKKKILAVALAVAMLAMIGYSTIAYFTSSDSAQNKITAGELKIAINEYETVNGAVSTTPATAGEDGITLFFDDVQPGDVCPKIAKVESLENSIDSWIRVKVTMSWDKEGLSTADTVITLKTDSKWTLAEDGYYYCSEKVAAGTEIDFLSEVAFSLENMNNDYQNASLTITLDADAVQSEHNGTTVSEAKGWPVKAAE